MVKKKKKKKWMTASYPQPSNESHLQLPPKPLPLRFDSSVSTDQTKKKHYNNVYSRKKTINLLLPPTCYLATSLFASAFQAVYSKQKSYENIIQG
jgi:hypothetical protein